MYFQLVCILTVPVLLKGMGSACTYKVCWCFLFLGDYNLHQVSTKLVTHFIMVYSYYLYIFCLILVGHMIPKSYQVPLYFLFWDIWIFNMVHRGLLDLNVIHHNVLLSPLILWIWSSPSYCWLILLAVCWQLSPCPQCFLNFGRRKEAMNIHCIWVGSSIVSVITFLLAGYGSLCESPSTRIEALRWELRVQVIDEQFGTVLI